MKLNRIKLSYTFAICILIFILALISCGPVDSGPSDNSLTNEAYPVLLSTSTPLAYPVEPIPTRAGTLLALDRPIDANQTTITGVGPSGLQVTVMNITFLGEELGNTIISDNGTFLLNVSPIPAGVRIGLTADLEASGIPEADIRPGEGELNTPRVGYFFDSVVVPQQN